MLKSLREVRLITNNPGVLEQYGTVCSVEYLEGSYLQVLERTRDLIHQGHRLLSHPLSGSIKPNENPYKSLIVCDEAAALDFDSLHVIEGSILTAKKFLESRGVRFYDVFDQDYQVVDLSLLDSAIKK